LMTIRRSFLVLALLALSSKSATSAVPGSAEITCDVDRTQFRTAARVLQSTDSVTFRLWTDEDPSPPNTQIGSDYMVPLSALNVIKRYTDRYDHVSPRKSARIGAVIGSDGSPVVLPVDGIAYIDVTVGAATLGCDHAATASATQRRRVQAVAFAVESGHSETCEACDSVAPPLVPPAACAPDEKLVWTGSAFSCEPSLTCLFTSEVGATPMSVACPAGDHATGGGCQLSGGAPNEIHVSKPGFAPGGGGVPTGWECAGLGSLRVWVVCCH
jgi:hypothetical protein